MNSFLRICLGVAVAIPPLSTAPAQSNWIDFVDETSTRLVLNVSNPALGSLGCDDEMDMAASDLDGDGDLDVVIVRMEYGYASESRTNFLLMNENGVFHDKTPENIPGFLLEDPSRDVACGDVDEDGDQDIMVANTFLEQPRLFLNDGTGVFTEAVDWFTSNGSHSFSPGPESCAVVLADIDGDLDQDIFLSTYGQLSSRMLVNDGTGHFLDESTARLGNLLNGNFVSGAAMEDFNGDGSPDIQVIRPAQSFRLLYNDTTGHFGCPMNRSAGALYMQGTGDFSGNGLADLYAVTDQQDLTLYNLGVDPQDPCDRALISQALFVKPSPRTVGLGGNVVVADIDGDGWNDAAVCDGETGEPSCVNGGFALLQNQGGITGRPFLKDPNGVGGTLITLPWNISAWDVAVFDVNDDGCKDLVMASSLDGVHIFIQTDCN